MSVGQEHDSGADDPDLIRLNKRSLFTPSASVAVEQHSAVPHVSRSTYGTAKVEGRLTSPNARVPEIITQRCGGITVKGHTLKSFAYTTDAVIIRNTNANAILAVYPFTGEPVITQALLTVAQMPLFVGVGGGTTTGPRVAELAMVAEMQGAAGVVINAPAPAETIETTMSMVDIPVIATVTEDDEITECKILAGAAIINVAAVETSLPSQAFGYCKASSIVRNRSDGCASNGSSNVTSILFGEVSDSRVQSQEYCALCDRADWMNRPRSAARVSWGGTSMASCACDSLTNVRMAPRRHSEAYSAPLATSW